MPENDTVEVALSIPAHWEHSPEEIATGVVIEINGRPFALLEVLAALLALGDDAEAIIDHMRADRLTGEHDWFQFSTNGKPTEIPPV
jgi:hypothetical protein